MSERSDAVPVGRVVGLWRYPVKSMAAEALSDAQIGWHGVAGDRRWAFVRDNVVRSGFPWLTLRQRADMSQFVPGFTDPANPKSSDTVVKTPSGKHFDVTDPALAEELGRSGARVIRQNRGIFDKFPLSLITTQTVSQLGESVGTKLDAQRFRPNILVEASQDTAFPEDSWVGRTLRIGGLRMRVDQRDGRCIVINIDPDTAQRNPQILRTVTDQRQGCLGVYGTTVEPGHVALADTVMIEP